MTDPRDIRWLAGLLEGEGWFGYYGTPRMTISMTDKDVVERVSRLTCKSITGPYYGPTRRPVYRVSLNGRLAVEWMMTVYSLMGERRRGAIKTVLAKWKLTGWSQRHVKELRARGQDPR